MAKKYEELPVEQSSFELELQELQQLYTFANPLEIRAYLQKHRFLIGLLRQTQPKIAEYFGQAELVLERTPIPETDPIQGKLEVNIHPTQKDTAEILDRYQKLKYNWWFDFSKQVKCHFWLDVKLPKDATIWDFLIKVSGTYDGPEDWSAEHNHYLYGTPKHNYSADDE